MLHPLLAAALEALDQTQVRWCLLRTPSDLGAPGGDVDILVDGAGMSRVSAALAKLNFAKLPTWGPTPHHQFIGYHPETDRWIWLDIVTRLSFGPYSLLHTKAEAACLRRSRREGPINLLHPSDAFWALMLHCLLDKGAIPQRHQSTLQALASDAQTGDALSQAVDAACPPGWSAARMVSCAASGDWNSLLELAPALLATWMRRSHVGPGQLFAQRVLRFAGKIANLRRYRGLSIALIGPDGAGKSSLAASLRTSFIFPARSIYMGLNGGYMTKLANLGMPAISIPGRLALLWLRYLLAQYHQSRGRLVVFDRYVYDALLPLPQPLGLLARTSRWLEARACPPADLIVMLNSTGETMYTRKGKRKHTPEELEAARLHYLALSQHIPHFELVDATRAQSDVRADVLDRIWKRYTRRWKQTEAI